MKKILFLVVCVGFLYGCSPSRYFISTVDGYTKVILPEYKAYVAKDTTISDDTKRIRTQSADKFQQLIDDAMKD